MARLLEDAGIDYWLFGGWAVDFYVGSLTRDHDDVDLAIWLEDHPRIARLLESDGWCHAPFPDEDGGTGYERFGVRLELTFLERRRDGTVTIPMRAGPVVPHLGLSDDVRELSGVRSRVITLQSLMRGKSVARGDARDAAKDRADLERLAAIRR